MRPVKHNVVVLMGKVFKAWRTVKANKASNARGIYLSQCAVKTAAAYGGTDAFFERNEQEYYIQRTDKDSASSACLMSLSLVTITAPRLLAVPQRKASPRDMG